MTMTTKTIKITISTIIAIAIIGSAFGYTEIIALDDDYQFDKSERPNAEAIAKIDEYEAKYSSVNFQKYSEIAFSDPDLTALGPEWELLNIANSSNNRSI